MENMYDLIIVGGGPAGLSAAIYMARAKYKTLVIEKDKIGGQILVAKELVNYPGVMHTSGEHLTQEMKHQAESFSAEFLMSEVIDMELTEQIKTIRTTTGEYKALSVVLALGASPKKLGFKGEDVFVGRGVAYCATCDGEFFKDMPIYVVGDGHTAVEEGQFLTKYASKLNMIVKGDKFDCDEESIARLLEDEKVSVVYNTEVVGVNGTHKMDSITLKNRTTKEVQVVDEYSGFGVFVFAGHIPNTSWSKGAIETDGGYFVTNAEQKTNLDGVFAAGDVCVKSLRQVATAVSDGATAGTSASKYVSKLKRELGLPKFELKAPVIREKKEESPKTVQNTSDDKFISDEMREQLAAVFCRFNSQVTINAVFDSSDLGREISGFVDEMQGISDNVLCKKSRADGQKLAPYLEILRANGSSSGIKFCAIPGGHEFNSFVIALYNVAGPGKEISSEEQIRIQKLSNATDIKVLISLSCTMCPEVVVATGKIASLNENIIANTIDIAHFPEIKQKYNVMSVPCMIINDDIVQFGKKSLPQILDILEKI
ncbi:MAG: FAD-dependent oxidoreductase [Clostridia bacterium]